MNDEMMKELRMETERLILEPMEPYQADMLFELLKDEKTAKFFMGYAYKDIEEAKEELYKYVYYNFRINDRNDIQYSMYAMFEKDTRNFVGVMQFCNTKWVKDGWRKNIGYALLPQYRGKGYMREAVTMVRDLFFEREPYLDELQIRFEFENEASANVAKACGFYYEESSIDSYCERAQDFLNEEIWIYSRADYDWAHSYSQCA